MNSGPVQSRTWSPLKWAVVIACILTLHAGLFIWFARPFSPLPGPPRTAPAVTVPPAPSGEFPGSVSPLVLVRPDIHGFSGRAWLQIPPITYNSQGSNPPPFLLSLQTNGLGDDISRELSNNLSSRFEVASRPELRLDNLNYLPASPETAPASSLAIQGELGHRLLAPPVLNPQPADTILTNTVVQITVDAQGNEFTPPVVLEPSGSAEADAAALAAARNLRFQPLSRIPGQPPPNPSSLAAGQLVFRWQSVPKPAAAAADSPANH